MFFNDSGYFGWLGGWLLAWMWAMGGLWRFNYPGTIRELSGNYPGFGVARLAGLGWTELAGLAWTAPSLPSTLPTLSLPAHTHKTNMSFVQLKPTLFNHSDDLGCKDDQSKIDKTSMEINKKIEYTSTHHKIHLSFVQ